MPTDEQKILKFQHTKHQQLIPFVIVADFEALTRKIDTCEPSTNTSYSMPYQKHEAICFCYYIIYQYGLFKHPVVYRGVNAAEKFMEMLTEEAKEIEAIYKTPKPMEYLSEKQKQDHEDATVCYLCQKKFTSNNWKVAEHCHITGKYRGPSCNQCNLQFKLPNFIPVFFS